jgi:hypothetical protein
MGVNSTPNTIPDAPSYRHVSAALVIAQEVVIFGKLPETA